MEEQNTEQQTQQEQPQQEQTQSQSNSGNEGNAKVVAIVSYLGLIGWIIAIIVHGNGKTSLGAYHLRQSLGIMLTGLVGSLVFWIPIVGWALAIGLLVFWILGLISAVNGQEKPVPVLGKFYQKTFAGLN